MTKQKKVWPKTVSSRSIQVPWMLSTGLFLLFLASLLMICPKAARSAEDSGAVISGESLDKPFGERKVLRGHIGSLNHEGLAFVYMKDAKNQTEHEMWLPFNKTVRFSGYSSQDDLKLGDEAVVTYEEDKKGTRRVLREINFVQHNEQPEQSEEAQAEPASSDETEAAE